MAYVTLDYEINNTLGKYILCSELEFLKTYEDIKNEYKQYDILLQAAETYNRISNLVEKDGFPDLCPPNYETLEKYPYYTLSPKKDLGLIDIPLDEIIGGNWANLPRADAPHYPYPRKIRDILTGYLNLKKSDSEVNMEPIPVYKIMEKYFAEEGNHRIYTSRLLKRETIKAVVIEYDYTALIKKSKIFENSDGAYLGVKVCDGQYTLYELSDEEKENFLILKEQISKQ